MKSSDFVFVVNAIELRCVVIVIWYAESYARGSRPPKVMCPKLGRKRVAVMRNKLMGGIS